MALKASSGSFEAMYIIKYVCEILKIPYTPEQRHSVLYPYTVVDEVRERRLENVRNRPVVQPHQMALKYRTHPHILLRTVLARICEHLFGRVGPIDTESRHERHEEVVEAHFRRSGDETQTNSRPRYVVVPGRMRNL